SCRHLEVVQAFEPDLAQAGGTAHVPPSRFLSLEAFGRRPRCQLLRRHGPASKTLHKSGLPRCNREAAQSHGHSDRSSLGFPASRVRVRGHNMRLGNCHNFHDFRALARRRLPGPIFDYIDGAADDEATLRQNAASFERCDLVPNVLRGVGAIDISVTVMGQKLAMPVYCSPTALQRLFHHQGERAVAAAAAKFGTMFGVSSLGTVSLEELRKAYDTSQIYQFYFHKDRALNHAMMQRAKDAGVNVMMLTVDSVTGGNRERDLRTGFSIPFKLTFGGMLQFAIKPMWATNYLTHERF